MASSDVAVVSGVRCERLATVLALEGLLTRVLADVSAKDARRCKRLAAVHALVRPLPAVHLQGFCLKKVDLCTEIFRYAVQYHLVCMSIFIYCDTRSKILLFLRFKFIKLFVYHCT